MFISREAEAQIIQMFVSKLEETTIPYAQFIFRIRDNMPIYRMRSHEVINTIVKRRARELFIRTYDIINRRYTGSLMREIAVRGIHDSITADEKSRINSSLFITLETLAVIRHLFFILSSLAATTTAVAGY